MVGTQGCVEKMVNKAASYVLDRGKIHVRVQKKTNYDYIEMVCMNKSTEQICTSMSCKK